MKKALFLDRDGVINVDYGHVYKKEDFVFVDGIFELCEIAQKNDYLIIIVTNQAGIAKGYYSEQDFEDLMVWVKSVFSNRGVTIDDVYYCPYHPEAINEKFRLISNLRKPGPGMLFSAAKKHNINLSKSIMVGDSITDVYAAWAAGIKNVYLIDCEISAPGDAKVVRSLEELVKCDLINHGKQ